MRIHLAAKVNRLMGHILGMHSETQLRYDSEGDSHIPEMRLYEETGAMLIPNCCSADIMACLSLL